MRGHSFSFDEGDTLLPSLTATAVTNADGNGTLTSSPLKSSPSDQPQSAVSIGQDWDTLSMLWLFEDASTIMPLAATLLGTETNNNKKDVLNANQSKALLVITLVRYNIKKGLQFTNITV